MIFLFEPWVRSPLSFQELLADPRALLGRNFKRLPKVSLLAPDLMEVATLAEWG